MIRTFLSLDVKPGQRDALIAWYKESGALEKAVEYAGCLSTELYPDAEDEDRLLVTALWESGEDYERWVAHPWRQSTTSQINQFLKEGFTPESRGSALESLHQASLTHS
ncbi:antibiotic biosynthesis monooxygenase family protein [Nesterenkonia ebinurensis]|uniref:antibiotic biosynthesis monooxygenase family protein n=1 Tax=Nesterenkonia ebinurensis TaxID=2608252 RepID=UPI00123D3D23|nr:antibiotic biosynthesis monooxygenase family protein [Nesterenkonia ebinurensis]